MAAPQSFDDLTVWSTRLPGVEQGLFPAHTDRPNPRLNDGMLFVPVLSPGCVYALDATTGEVCWRRELNYLGGSSVELAKGRLFAKTARTLFALDPASGSTLWEFSPYGLEGETLYSEPAVDGDRLFAGDRRGWLHCLHLETGETIWKQKAADGPNRNVNATAVVVEGVVITGTNAGFAMAYSVEDGRPVWQAKLDGPCINHLFLVGKQLVVAAASLHFFDPVTGEEQGRLSWPGSFVSFAAGTPSLAVVFTCSAVVGGGGGEPVERESETLFAFEGTRLVREMRCSGYATAVRYSNATGLLYASGACGLDILNPETGARLHSLWSSERAGGCGLPDVANDRIYLMDGEGVVYALRHPPVSR